MRILDRYIGQTVAGSTLSVMFILVALFTFFTFAGELNKTGKGYYDTWQAAQYALITMPAMLYQLFPTAALIGTMMGLGILGNNSELIAMRAAGYSLMAILRSVLMFGLLMMMTVFFIGEYLAPVTQAYAETKRSLAISGKDSLQTGSALWIRDGLKFIKIGEIQSGAQWTDVKIFELNESQKIIKTLTADLAIHIEENRWVLVNSVERAIHDDGVSIETKPGSVWSSWLSPALLDVAVVRPDMMSAEAALTYVDYLVDNGIDARKYLQAFWSKVTAPISTGIMILLAIPFIFGSMRSMSAGHRILIGTLVGIGFYLFGQIFSYVGLVYELNPFMAATLPSFLFLGVGIMMMRRIR